MSLIWPNKDPDAVLDYKADWTNWLDGDEIATSDWTVPDGLTVESVEFDTTSATIWLSGGVSGTRYEILNRITTAGGRTDDRTIILVVKEK